MTNAPDGLAGKMKNAVARHGVVDVVLAAVLTKDLVSDEDEPILPFRKYLLKPAHRYLDPRRGCFLTRGRSASGPTPESGLLYLFEGDYLGAVLKIAATIPIGASPGVVKPARHVDDLSGCMAENVMERFSETSWCVGQTPSEFGSKPSFSPNPMRFQEDLFTAHRLPLVTCFVFAAG